MTVGSRWEVTLKTSAQKELKRLPKNTVINIYESIKNLAGNPRPSGCVKLKGFSNMYRVRSGRYRVIYTVQDNTKTVVVLHIGPRNDRTYK